MLITLLALGGCPSSKEIRTARTSAYDADFAIVYSETLQAVHEIYPEGIDDNPATGVIRTAWQPVAYQSGAGDAQSGGGQANGDPATGGTAAGVNNNGDPSVQGGDPHNFTTTSGALGKAQFIRFDVKVAGGRPWHIDVEAYASEWDQGNAEPTMLKGPATPHWLAGRRDAMVVAIYRRLKQYAVHYEAPKDVEVAVVPTGPVIDPKTFGAIPAGAVTAATAIVKAVETRDTAGLRAQLSDDVQWSLGADGDADTAMAMWQADPQTLATLGTILRAGCRGDDKAVTCPPDATETPGYVGWRAKLEPKGASWKLTSFVQGD